MCISSSGKCLECLLNNKLLLLSGECLKLYHLPCVYSILKHCFTSLVLNEENLQYAEVITRFLGLLRLDSELADY